MGKNGDKMPVGCKRTSFFSQTNPNKLHVASRKWKDQPGLVLNRVVHPGDIKSFPVYNNNPSGSKIVMSVVVCRRSRLDSSACGKQNSFVKNCRCLKINCDNQIQFKNKISMACNASMHFCFNNYNNNDHSVCFREKEKSFDGNNAVSLDERNTPLCDSDFILDDCHSTVTNSELKCTKLYSSPCVGRNLRKFTDDHIMSHSILNSNDNFSTNEDYNLNPNYSNYYGNTKSILNVRSSSVNNVIESESKDFVQLVAADAEMDESHMTSEDFLHLKKLDHCNKSQDKSLESFSSSDSALSLGHKSRRLNKKFVLNISKDSFVRDIKMKMSALELLSCCSDPLSGNTSTISPMGDLSAVDSEISSSCKELKNCSPLFGLKLTDVTDGSEYGDESLESEADYDIVEEDCKDRHIVDENVKFFQKNSSNDCYSSFSYEDDFIKQDVDEAWASDADLEELEEKELFDNKSVIELFSEE